MDQLSELRSPSERLTSIPIETIPVGQMQVTLFPLDHDQPLEKVDTGPGQSALQLLVTEVERSNGIIVEYFPDEINKLPHELQVIYKRKFEERKSFFTSVVNVAARKGIPALVADPAHDLWFERA